MSTIFCETWLPRDDHDHQHPRLRQRHELDALEDGVLVRRARWRSRRGARPRTARARRSTARGRTAARRRPARAAGPRRSTWSRVPRRRFEQHVHVVAVAQVGRHPAGRGVGLPDVAHVLELGQDVADGGRRHTEPGAAAEGGRGHRLAAVDVVPHQGGQDPARALGEDRGRHGGVSTRMLTSARQKYNRTVRRRPVSAVRSRCDATSARAWTALPRR